MKNYLNILFVGLALSLSSCFGDHNEAPYSIEGVNLDSERIYGNGEGTPPRQLATKYPDPTEKTLNRIENIREKLFPKSADVADMGLNTPSTQIDSIDVGGTGTNIDDLPPIDPDAIKEGDGGGDGDID